MPRLPLWEIGNVLGSFARDNSLPFAHDVKPVGYQSRELLLLAVGPNDFGFIKSLVTAQAEVEAKVALREITSAANQFAELNQISRRRTHARIQRQPIASDPLQLKTDPMIGLAAHGAKNHGFADKVFDDGVQLPHH